MIIPMIPSLVMLMWCTIFPLWIRIAGVLLAVPFGAVFYRVVRGFEFFHWTVYVAYGLLGTLEVVWAVMLWQDFARRQQQPGTPRVNNVNRING